MKKNLFFGITSLLVSLSLSQGLSLSDYESENLPDILIVERELDPIEMKPSDKRVCIPACVVKHPLSTESRDECIKVCVEHRHNEKEKKQQKKITKYCNEICGDKLAELLISDKTPKPHAFSHCQETCIDYLKKELPKDRKSIESFVMKQAEHPTDTTVAATATPAIRGTRRMQDTTAAHESTMVGQKHEDKKQTEAVKVEEKKEVELKELVNKIKLERLSNCQEFCKMDSKIDAKESEDQKKEDAKDMKKTASCVKSCLSDYPPAQMAKKLKETKKKEASEVTLLLSMPKEVAKFMEDAPKLHMILEEKKKKGEKLEISPELLDYVLSSIKLLKKDNVDMTEMKDSHTKHIVDSFANILSEEEKKKEHETKKVEMKTPFTAQKPLPVAPVVETTSGRK